FKVVKRPEAVVHISGPVRRPGTYQYRPGMRIRDLLSVAEGLLPDAQVFWKRAEIYRTGADKREQLITFNLKAVLDGEEDANIQLKPGDRVVIYREEEVRAPLTVTASGALQRPGTYKLTAGMTVKDLLMAAGGLREDAYSKRAELWRRTDGYLRQIITLNLDEILRDGKHDVPLQPFDELRVYRPDEISVPPSVVVRGCVQMPGTYEYAVGMHLSDLLAAAGGILPNAYRKRADLIRYDEGEERVLYSVDIERVLAHDPSHDLELQPRDELIVYSDEEVRTPHIVQIQGAVQRPGSYPRPMNMRVSDLLFQAGGLLPNAYTERAFLIRQHPNGVSKLVVINLDRAQAGDP
ncbi:MAG TPA: hypothetical protein EYP10_12005, partial [Armatimonadetes bacterium]|nr:hypothetical protein [Armatimonadota bacterium]